ncbi:integrin-linked kinase-associated serine/threonine phosphatase [Columba livia]|uniref:Integrin-linked kinase-associated serine/threonine phosphatase 2C n=1 Tax=Columba livia TaxID=8932 RepID=A0A2I0MBK6_COLLI|nr:integrin-linked kinase-associated serine/threonine phosphatase 2C [Columba livia]PKK27063.1 integrin-linked kinase-associated serine/threonine phosphatase [Columba livia]
MAAPPGPPAPAAWELAPRVPAIRAHMRLRGKEGGQGSPLVIPPGGSSRNPARCLQRVLTLPCCLTGKEAQKEPLLFDDLPPATGVGSGRGGSLLFDDLPPASSGDTASSAAEQVSTGESHGKGEKRKSLEEEEKNGREELVEKKVCKGSVGILGLKGYVAERKGEREDMQDAHVILNDITEECQPLPSQITRVSYFAVFDGHGGVRASKFAAQNLHQNLIKKFPKGEVVSVEKTVKRCLLDTFKHTDDEFLKQASSQKPAWKDGSTATCVLAVDNILYIANLGDSRAILCRYNEESQKHAALSLSKEHNPTQYEERMRIQKAGGNVREGRVLGVLEVSRSIGDGQYKRCGVISVPDIKRCQLTHNDRFILIACDGLFKVFTPEEAVNFIVSCLEDKNIQTREGKLEADARYEAACNRLANKAVQRGSADNVTVMVVRIEH